MDVKMSNKIQTALSELSAALVNADSVCPCISLEMGCVPVPKLFTCHFFKQRSELFIFFSSDIGKIRLYISLTAFS